MKQVVRTLFFKDKKLLIDKPRKRKTFQMIGGSVEENESIFDAAVRECKEELGENAIFDSSKKLDSEDIEILDLIKNKKSIIILNKCDLETKIDEKNTKLNEASDYIIKISALKNIGIDLLYKKISEFTDEEIVIEFDVDE